MLFASLSAGAAMDAAVDRAAADEMGRAAVRVEALEERGLSPRRASHRSGLAGRRSRRPGPGAAHVPGGRPGPDAAGRAAGAGDGAGRRPGRASLRSTTCHSPAGVCWPPADARSAAGDRQTLAGPEGLRVGDTIDPQRRRWTGAAGLHDRRHLERRRATCPGRRPPGHRAAGRGPDPVRHRRRHAGGSGPARGRKSQPTVIAQLEASIDTEPYLLALASDTAASLRNDTADLRATLLLVAAVVLFAGAFLIFNTLSMTVSERTREVGLLRAAGTTRPQVMMLMLLAGSGTGGGRLGGWV